MHLTRFLFILITSVSILSCNSSRKIAETTIPRISKLQFIDEYDIPNGMQFRNTTVGGLSGIEYDPVKGVYYIISDDRSDRNPVRFYTAKIFITEKGIDSVQFLDAVTILDKNGQPYPSHEKYPLQTPDPEAIRYNPTTNQLLWSSEGERVANKRDTALQDPAIFIMTVDGKYISTFEMPDNMHSQSIEKGPRRNGVFEGIDFINNNRYLFASVEEPLYEDGARAGSGDSTAWVRFIKFDTKNRKPIAQYAYQIEALAHAPVQPGGFRVNGVSEILYIGNDQFIVMERSFSAGRNSNSIRLFLADTRHAADVSSIPSLDPAPPVQPITKKLLLNMDELGIDVFNVEGMTIGPDLPNGNKTLILVSDDNFSKEQKTQFFLFEVLQ